MEDKKFEEYLAKYSKENQRVVYSGGMSTCGTLGVVFVTLKLLGYINWSWWWVTIPFWGPLAFALSLVIFILICMIPIAFLKTKEIPEEEKESTESRTDSINSFIGENSIVTNSDSNYIVTPEFLPKELCENSKEDKNKVEENSCKEATEEKSKKKRSNKHKTKKNVESNITTETGPNK